MKQYLATLSAELSVPERNKFTAPLLLIHGLWTGSWMWQNIATALSLRGWECWALDLRRHPGSQSNDDTIGKIRLEDDIEAVATAIQQLWAPPVVWGADLGALIALQAATLLTSGAPRALICSAPLLPRSWIPDERPALPLVRLPALPALLWGRSLAPPRLSMAQEFLFPGFTPALQQQLHTQLRPDSGTVVRTLTRHGGNGLKQPESTLPGPLFVVRGQRDRMSSAAACEWLVAHLQADQHIYPDLGYWLYSGPSAIRLVTDVHRWIIQALGEPLLVPPEDEENEED